MNIRFVGLGAMAPVDGYYADVQKMGSRRWDTSSLLARMRRTPQDDYEESS